MPAPKRTKSANGTRSKTAAEVPKQKHLRLRQSKIDRARKLLGTRTDAETIEQALDLVAFGEAVSAGIRGLYGSGLTNVVDDPE